MKRDLLPNRRRAITFDLEWPPHLFKPRRATITIGLFEDGRPGEVFVTSGKSGEELEAAWRDGAIVVSFALQHRADFDAIRKAITRDETGAPASMLGAIIERAGQELDRLRPPDEPQAADPPPAPKPNAPAGAEHG